MLKRIIGDIGLSLENDAYISALALALTLPDICGKAEYPNETSSKKRYKDWYDTYIGVVYKNALESDSTLLPYFSGEIIYSLRCSLLHQGTPNVEDKLELQFSLICEPKKENGLYMDSAMIRNNYRSLAINIRGLCNVLTVSANAYYEKYPEKFDFFNYCLICKL